MARAGQWPSLRRVTFTRRRQGWGLCLGGAAAPLARSNAWWDSERRGREEEPSWVVILVSHPVFAGRGLSYVM